MQAPPWVLWLGMGARTHVWVGGLSSGVRRTTVLGAGRFSLPALRSQGVDCVLYFIVGAGCS